jgi:hypothetical protein
MTEKDSEEDKATLEECKAFEEYRAEEAKAILDECKAIDECRSKLSALLDRGWSAEELSGLLHYTVTRWRQQADKSQEGERK